MQIETRDHLNIENDEAGGVLVETILIAGGAR
jgi:hypothetical protein